ncbi:hypothetical protein OBV_33280 [Oscillibacter valericigenes Sjm18-20]|nr:hypothetical protein OBV_33280 [Oscillibacter valericigenes Sjm18-20]
MQYGQTENMAVLDAFLPDGSGFNTQKYTLYKLLRLLWKIPIWWFYQMNFQPVMELQRELRGQQYGGIS